jgi:hypothetical protein
MRALMGLIKDRHGTYYAQRKVPERLQEAVARILNSGRSRQVFLKKSLGTKNLKAANVTATHVLADFNRTIADAEALLKARPVIPSLSEAQIKRMSEPEQTLGCQPQYEDCGHLLGRSERWAYASFYCWIIVRTADTRSCPRLLWRTRALMAQRGQALTDSTEETATVLNMLGLVSVVLVPVVFDPQFCVPMMLMSCCKDA